MSALIEAVISKKLLRVRVYLEAVVRDPGPRKGLLIRQWPWGSGGGCGMSRVTGGCDVTFAGDLASGRTGAART